MKDLKLKENEVVHCKTEKQAKKVLKIAHKLGLKWSSGISYEKNTDWMIYEENSVFYLNEGMYGSKKHTAEKYTIITAKEFLKRHKKDKTDKLEDRFVDYSKQVKEVLEGFKDLITGQRKDIDNLIKQQSVILESYFKEDTSEVKSDIPKVGDIVKAWDEDENYFIYGIFKHKIEDVTYQFTVGDEAFLNIEKAPEEITKYFK